MTPEDLRDHVEREIDRTLVLLRRKIKEQGFTQLEVQDALGWGRSYVSQLLTKQKALRQDQVFAILAVIGVAPAAFFTELYGPRPPVWESGARAACADEVAALQHEITALWQIVQSLETPADLGL